MGEKTLTGLNDTNKDLLYYYCEGDREARQGKEQRGDTHQRHEMHTSGKHREYLQRSNTIN